MIPNFNTENWPIVFLKLENDYEINDEMFDEYKKRYLSLLVSCKRKGTKIALIVDINKFNNTENIPIKYIMKQVQFNKEIYKFNKEYLYCVCILCKSKTFKNILNMYFAFTKPAAPFKLCRSIEKANLFIKDKTNLNFDISVFYNNEIINYINDNNDIDEEDSDNVNDYEEDIENINEDNNLTNDIEKFVINNN